MKHERRLKGSAVERVNLTALGLQHVVTHPIYLEVRPFAVRHQTK